jgi:hypothetical protein
MGDETQGKRFEATGPNEGSDPHGVSGFYTNAEHLAYGVNVFGDRCGVYGESRTNGSGSPEPFTRSGVCGRGDIYGVVGQGAQAGVTGFGVKLSNDPPLVPGVLGASFNDGPGVAGLSLSINASDHLGFGTGMVGASNEGAGVVGLSIKTVILRDEESGGGWVLPDDNTPADGDGTGVIGASGSGTGVHGHSNSGRGGHFESTTDTGVYGLSTHDRGGQFESMALVAQVRLVPVKQKVLTAQLPKNGKVGDMLMIRNTAKNEDGQTEDRCSLWLCVPTLGQPGFEDSSQWQEVVLGNSVTGQA